MTLITRAGKYVRQPQGYRAFIPARLPPDPPVTVDAAMLRLLSRADQALGRLDGIAQTLPNPNLFVAMYVNREAVFSSQIEGTQSTLDDVLEFQLGATVRDLPTDVEEVVNYIRAMNYGLQRLETFPLSLRLIREIHAELLHGVRGQDRTPGEFRTTQNWIGAADSPLSRAAFVPPPVSELNVVLGDFERFLHADHDLPILLVCGLAHAQFETIHPFLDGNGRVGRLLITFLLCQREVLHRPLLYLSYFLKRHRTEYYDRLMAIRDSGNWEGWLAFFLRGVAETAEEATQTVRAIVSIREQHRSLLQEQHLGSNAVKLLDLLFEKPIINVGYAKEHMKVSFATANKLIDQFVTLGLLHQITPGPRKRVFRYAPYLTLFDERAPDDGESVPPQRTVSER
ncbi:MAG TPA: Fic family protein [Thermomicrobiales bacterium]|nr:Fic family protein [Thermomicrobiales bacterium]